MLTEKHDKMPHYLKPFGRLEYLQQACDPVLFINGRIVPVTQFRIQLLPSDEIICIGYFTYPTPQIGIWDRKGKVIVDHSPTTPFTDEYNLKLKFYEESTD